jgi:hypothetical protein
MRKFMVMFFGPHHKNDGHSGDSGAEIRYALPRGPLTMLMGWFLSEGFWVLEPLRNPGNPYLFTTMAGNPFAEGRSPQFTTWWRAVQSQEGAPFKHFSPNKGRHLFVTAFMASNGTEPGDWEAAAVAMGTSVARWKDTYGLGAKRIQCQRLLDGFSLWRKRSRKERAGQR